MILRQFKNLFDLSFLILYYDNMNYEDQIYGRYKFLSPNLNERTLRLFAASEAKIIGRGGVSMVSRATSISRNAIMRGIKELDAQQKNLKSKSQSIHIRRKGGGRHLSSQVYPDLHEELDKLVEPTAKGDPESPLRWTIKSARTLSIALKEKGISVSPTTILKILKAKNFRQQSNKKTKASAKQHPDRNAQFEFINSTVKKEMKKGNPVISVDSKKKELIGNFKNNGRQWLPKGEAYDVSDHDFPDLKMLKGIPRGAYDLKCNKGHITIGTNHDTAEFAVNSLYEWWKKLGKKCILTLLKFL
jgi:hypothetical protein